VESPLERGKPTSYIVPMFRETNNNRTGASNFGTHPNRTWAAQTFAGCTGFVGHGAALSVALTSRVNIVPVAPTGTVKTGRTTQNPLLFHTMGCGIVGSICVRPSSAAPIPFHKASNRVGINRFPCTLVAAHTPGSHHCPHRRIITAHIKPTDKATDCATCDAHRPRGCAWIASTRAVCGYTYRLPVDTFTIQSFHKGVSCS